jgi:gluconate 2-dehydrogenase gamma chain
VDERIEVAGEAGGDGRRGEDFWATVGALADTVFPPDDEGPGGARLGVVDYVRGVLAGPFGDGSRTYRQPPFEAAADSGHGWQSELTVSDVWDRGVAALDELCQETRRAPFRDLDPPARSEALHAVDGGTAAAFGNPSGPVFVKVLREHVIEGLFADPSYGGNAGGAGWRWLGYPGVPALDVDHSTDHSPDRPVGLTLHRRRPASAQEPT